MQVPEMRSVVWLGDSKKKLREFPEEVQYEIGFALHRAQWRMTHHTVKPLQGFSGIYEIVSDYARNAYRAVYVVNLGKRIYVLHCFQKKSKRRIKTPKKEITLIRRRLNAAKVLARQEK